MKKIYIAFLIFAGLLIASGGCKKYDDRPARQAREEWIGSLDDSIANIQKARSADSVMIETLRTTIDSEIKNFSQVNNPKEVEPYYILSKFRGAYPLKSTGVAARISKSLQFEIIAALSGKRFDAIRFTDASNSGVTSTVVAPDQGLNYLGSDGLAVAAFTGSANDTLGQFVDRNFNGKLRMDFISRGATIASIPLSDAQKQWIATTWKVASDRHRLDSLENMQILNSRKLEILNITKSQKSK